MYAHHEEQTPFLLRFLGWPPFRVWLVLYGPKGKACYGYLYYEESVHG